MVEGYLRTSPDALTGRIIGTQACAASQLSGVIARMLRHTLANMCLVVEVSEETFYTFYQERPKHHSNGQLTEYAEQ